MQQMFFRPVAVLSLTLFCYSIHAQTTPTFSFSSPHKVTTGTSSNAGHAWTQAAVDVNGSGNTDLVVNIASTRENDILMGNGDGGFVLTKSNVPSPNQGNLDSSPPWTFVDTNRDGYADILTFDGGYYAYDPENNCEYDQTQNGKIYISLGDGHGNFTLNSAATMEMAPATNISAVIGDFNGDGLKDVALLTTANEECAPNQGFLYLLLNNGDGTFTMHTVPMGTFGELLPYGNSLVAGDFNGDGKLDLAFFALGGTYDPIQVLYGNGDGTFQIGPVYKVNTSTMGVDGILAADLNGDGRTDLVIHGQTNSLNPHAAIVTLLAKKTGNFYWYSEVSAPADSIMIGLMDLNNDGKLDLAYYSYDPSTKITSLRVHPGLGSGKFGASSLIRNLASDWENDIIAPLKTGGPLDVFYALSYPPNKNVYLYEMLNQSK